MPQSLAAQARAGAINSVNAEYIDQLYEAFRADPDSVSNEWRHYFYGFEHSGQSRIPDTAPPAADTGNIAPTTQIAVDRLVRAYRLLGHLVADIDPLRQSERRRPRELDADYYGLKDASLQDHVLQVSVDPEKNHPVHELIQIMERVYCGAVGVEYLHISNPEEQRWLEQRLESTHGDWQRQHSESVRRDILGDLTAAEGLEQFLHRRYVGQKRFSLEGGDALIPLLDELIQGGGARGLEHCVIGMAHRGRLNVLVNILGKAPQELFSEFEGNLNLDDAQGSGDVKYHQGFYSDIQTPGGPVHVSLAFNPSHLEIVGAVVEGGCRARMDRLGENGPRQVLPVLIHGDAAFIGQGVVPETLNLSQLPAYGTGGSLHIVINNQIGFTTSLTEEARSTRYCTDVAKLIEAPIFHVNGDDPDAVVFITQLALDYRMTFRKDVVIDLVCYRRHGHNEADEPMMTQPAMYRRIHQMDTTRAVYARRLARQGVIAENEARGLVERYRRSLDDGKVVVREFLHGSASGYKDQWRRFLNARPEEPVCTQVGKDRLIALGRRTLDRPAGFELQRRVAKVYEERGKMLDGTQPLDWGMAETLAYATLLDEGKAVRISGQDAGRGTFSHRHAVLHDQQSHQRHIPLEHMAPDQPSFQVINSPLSELAVLGFEYGYATSSPEHLVIWEAQFGDFANGGQIVIDQFISSGYLKWGRFCQLTLFLPHGYEGQGPEHSSARPERFLQLCAELNMRVWAPSTPAQFYHLLRDQMLRSFRRPLVVLTPKSLLRHPLSKSALDDLAGGSLALVQPEVDPIAPEQTRRVVLCSGKIYFELLSSRRQREIDDIAILRIEQLYPFPRKTLAKTLAAYANARELVWCQEEPRNQGAWYQIQHHLRVACRDDQTLGYAGRAPSASPACGYRQLHLKQQQNLIDTALRAEPVDDPGERLEDTDVHGWSMED